MQRAVSNTLCRVQPWRSVHGAGWQAAQPLLTPCCGPHVMRPTYFTTGQARLVRECRAHGGLWTGSVPKDAGSCLSDQFSKHTLGVGGRQAQQTSWRRRELALGLPFGDCSTELRLGTRSSGGLSSSSSIHILLALFIYFYQYTFLGQL